MKMHKQDVTIYDVAREAKVSMATVSRVLMEIIMLEKKLVIAY